MKKYFKARKAKNSFTSAREGGERGECCITDLINLIYISMISSLNQPNYKQGQAL